MDTLVNLLNVRLHAEGKHCEFRDKFKKLKTDQERVIFSLNVIQEYKMVPCKTGMPKNAKESEKLREQGNKVFVQGTCNSMTCVDALKLYTKSIAFAPYPSEQLALAYANRSAVLFQLGLYSECIQDIDRALALNYPDDLKVKLYVRKTECLTILGSYSIEDTFKEAQYWLDKMSLNNVNRKKLQAKLDTLHCKTVQTKLNTENTSVQSQPKKLEKEFPVPIIVSHNNEIPCASDAIAVKYNESYGRHVVATRNIRPGEILAIEKPYSVILAQKSMETHCSNCLRVCWANIPCDYCTYAMYCSEECKHAEWKKCHDVECDVFPALIEYAFYNTDFLSMRLAVLAIREAGGMQELRAMLKEVDECEDPRTKGFSRDGKLHSDKYISIYSLMTNTEKRSTPDLFRRSFDTSFILYFLATRTTMFGTKLPEDLNLLKENDDVTFFGGLILKHQQIIPNNMHSISEEYNLEVIQCGIAAMPFLSLINHSCSSNVCRNCKSEYMLIYATYPIRKGEQIFENYGEHYAITPRTKRQQKLLQQYYFTCNCIPCQEDWPLYFELQSFKSLVKKPEDKNKITKALRKLNAYVDIVTVGNVQDKPYIVKDLIKMIQVLYDYAPMPCEEMSNVIETLKRIFDLNGNRFVIPKMVTYRK